MSDYKRLTIRNNDFIDINCKNCKQCKKVGRKYICNDMTACDEEIINRLAELEDKIENRTLIELPYMHYIESASLWEIIYLKRDELWHYRCSYKAEAKAKLKELKEKNNEI